MCGVELRSWDPCGNWCVSSAALTGNSLLGEARARESGLTQQTHYDLAQVNERRGSLKVEMLAPCVFRVWRRLLGWLSYGARGGGGLGLDGCPPKSAYAPAG
jgi:hypothetical protein